MIPGGGCFSFTLPIVPPLADGKPDVDVTPADGGGVSAAERAHSEAWPLLPPPCLPSISLSPLTPLSFPPQKHLKHAESLLPLAWGEHSAWGAGFRERPLKRPESRYGAVHWGAPAWL